MNSARIFQVSITFAIAAIFVAGCNGAVSTSKGSDPATASPSCPPPSPVPTPYPAWLSYPPNGTTNVPVNAGEIIERGAYESGEYGLAITLVTAAGANVPLGTPTIAPSPFPTPFSTPPPTYPIISPYVAIAIPTLSPNTTYNVSDTYTGWSDNPPACSALYTQAMGSFTTGN